MDLGNILHIVLLLMLSLVTYIVNMNRRSLTERIDGLEKLLDEVRKDIDQATPLD